MKLKTAKVNAYKPFLYIFMAPILLAMGLISAKLASQTSSANRSLVTRRQEQVRTIINQAYSKFKNDKSGKNADFKPYLANVDSNLFGIAVVTTDNQSYAVGDTGYGFSMQSISKVFTLALAMQDVGAEEIFRKIGSQPAGRPFNSMVAMADVPGHTGNPIVNAEAIAAISLVPAKNGDERWNRILDFYSKAAGEKLSLIDEVYQSEAAANQGNRALAPLLLKHERIFSDPIEAIDVYTKACSVGVNVKQLAQMGATLANNGINTVTGQQVIKPAGIPHILSSMTMAGLYDGSGGWAWEVGLPVKSGVAGGILAVTPGRGAIAVFSPRLDEAGNSVRAQKVIDYVAEKLHMNLFSPRSAGLR
jgi:glutaminase